ncbi:hypothetical protein EDB92DRAFT_1817595 [Lactarius akahatsu]|uniref:Uncharacterized protein n=1 Tax=Lactarius akahatsu TaxID=416441 RepID=A0AAD4LH69_9AGAM|nr:hypothetical protein EDB92DRAFT_1817595 [Lactarius akahatsu]
MPKDAPPCSFPPLQCRHYSSSGVPRPVTYSAQNQPTSKMKEAQVPPGELDPTQPGGKSVSVAARIRAKCDIIEVYAALAVQPGIEEAKRPPPLASRHSIATFFHSGSRRYAPYRDSLPAPIAPSPSYRMSSARNLGTFAEGEGSAKAALHKERGVLDPPSAVRENIMAAPDFPAQSVTDTFGAEPSPPHRRLSHPPTAASRFDKIASASRIKRDGRPEKPGVFWRALRLGTLVFYSSV